MKANIQWNLRVLIGSFLFVAITNCAEADDWDPSDDTSSNATLLVLSEEIQTHGPHTLSVADTADWFKFSLQAGCTYRFESTGNADTRAYLYSANDTTNAINDSDDSSDTNFNFRMLYPAVDTGDYYLKVEDVYGGGLGSAEYALEYVNESSVNPDSDGDGLPDSWEIQYFGSTNAQPNAYGDSDPFSNLQEYIAGTDPTNWASFFAVTSGQGGGFIVQWPSVALRQYKVLWAQSLTNSFQQQGPMIDYPQSGYTDTVHNAEARGFYKVQVQLQ